MRSIRRLLARLWADESGISSVEYALLLSFVAVGILLGAEQLANAVADQLSDAASCIETGGATC